MYNNCWIHITLPLKPGPSPSEFRWTKAPPKPKAKPKAKQSPLEIEPAPAESTEVAKVEEKSWNDSGLFTILEVWCVKQVWSTQHGSDPMGLKQMTNW